jgi:hypothetical protein
VIEPRKNMSQREIITLQFGNHANFVATHFWNILQTELQQSNDVRYPQYFREGETHDEQPTYTPRAVIFEEKKEWGSLKASGYLYDDDDDINTFNDDDDESLEVMKEKEFGMSKFTRTLLASDPNTLKYIQHEVFDEREVMDEDDDEDDVKEQRVNRAQQQVKNYTRDDILNELDDKARFWTDYLISHLHPKTAVKLPDYQDDAKQIFSVQGVIDRYSEDSLDQLRFFLEESDNVSAIQLFSNSGDWWSSVSTQFTAQIRDEFGRIPIISTLVQPYVSNEASMEESEFRKFLTYSALGLVNTYNHSDYVLPLSATQSYEWSSDYLQLGANPNAYKWSSVLGTAWESLSRIMVSTGPSDWIAKMTPRSTLRIGTLDSRIPLGLGADENLHDFLTRCGPLHDRKSILSLSPQDKYDTELHLPYAQSIVFRGIDTSTVPLYKLTEKPKQLSVQEIFLQHVLGTASQSTRNEYQSRIPSQENRTVLSNCDTHEEMLDNYIEQTKTYSTTR